MAKEQHGPAIVRGIWDGRRSYVAGHEVDLAGALSQDGLDRLVQRGALRGEWVSTYKAKSDARPAKNASGADSAAPPRVRAESDLPTVADLPDFLSGFDSAAEVRRLAKLDARVTAAQHYDARLAELSGDGEE